MKLQPTDYSAEIDSMIRAGQFSEACSALQKIKMRSIPREQMAVYANFSRRLGIESWGLQLLRPILRSEKPIYPKASVEEKTIYAALLIKAGAVIEALNMLEALQSEKLDHPDIFLYSAYAHIARWEYSKVILYLKKYLKKTQISTYQATIAKVNLAAALVHEEKEDEATSVLKDVDESCKENNWTLLQCNSYEIAAQIAIKQKNWKHAENLLSQAEILGKQAQHYLLFVEKWRVLAKLIQQPNSKQVFLEFEKVRQKAQIKGDWETLRDLDLQKALCSNDTALLLKLYSGTPYRFYRKKIEGLFKKNSWVLPDYFIWSPNSEEVDRILDLTEGTENGEVILKSGQSLHRFLILMSMDFYRPQSVGFLFLQLYPGEYFNPVSSADRIFQTIQKVRSFFKEHNIPLEVQVEDGQYRLHSTGSYGLKLKRNFSLKSPEGNLSQDSILNRLKAAFPYKSFSIMQAATKMNASTTSIRTTLKKAHQETKVFISGKGRSTLYRFKK
jgi:hypothetical protein